MASGSADLARISGDGQSPKSRVLLLGMYRLTSEIMSSILERHQSIEIVDFSGESPPTARLHEATDVDLIVVDSANKVLARRCRDLVEMQSRTRLLAVEEDGRRAFLYELRPAETPLGELSPELLLETAMPRSSTS